MNRTFSSKIPKKPSLSVAPAKNEDCNQRKKKQSTSHNPFQDLDAISSCSHSNCSEAFSASIEVPRGCLGFFLSHYSSSSSTSSSNSKSKIPIERPKTLAKTPKSAPNGRVSKLSRSKTSKENKLSNPTVEENPDRLVSKKTPRFKKNPPCLYQWQSVKKTHSRTAQKSQHFSALNNGGDSANNLPFGSEGEGLVRMVDDVREATELKPRDADATCTPLTKTYGSALDCEVGKFVEESSNKSNGKTPPVQASLSPEIQCGSVVSTAIIPACYGAGHIISGVADKRKCRPRGILTVGEHDFSFGGVKPFDSFDGDEEENVIGIGDDSTVIHEPTEASMHWLLSPCNEEDEGPKENSEDDGSCRRRGLGGHDIIQSPSSPSTGQGFSSDEGLSPMSSPHATPRWEAITAKEGRENCFDLEGKNSPFSMDSLGSGNVMRTPQSESSSDRLVGLSWLNEDSYKKDHFESELNLVAEVLQMTSLSPKSHISIGGPFDSSFQFDCLTTSSRCLSDEEKDAHGCSDNQLKSCRSPDANVDVASDQTLTNNSRSTEYLDNEPRTEGNSKEQFPSQISCPCAESISTDGGGLVASRDSDWTLCYKNHLFEE
ncbi:hypothetical protein CIPAW_01G202000 [Carya illinoinensis]|uniref:Uncharacterized protein n=1 Tax=Carya illinoinensis TaxID=32201 RepID=A0A8T1RQ66_CARIL|nr:hypothetical protein CIPAW_01G202000 [Carya illinoinensis]